MYYHEVDGDLIELALEGNFDAIVHGCNCFCVMRRGIAPQMDRAFGCNDPDKYPSEAFHKKGDVNKLGTIEWTTQDNNIEFFQVINAYTQYHYKWNNLKSGVPLNYEALRMCMMKINEEFSGAHIGLPKIGCGVAGGDWEKVKKIIKEELIDCGVTIVKL